MIAQTSIDNHEYLYRSPIELTQITVILLPKVTHLSGVTRDGYMQLEGTEQVIDTSTGERSKAPVVVSGDNIYVAWWNGTAGLPDVQTDVMFRASNDGGETFGDKINLSNSSEADSGRVEIAAEGADVIVSWWETNQTSDTPVARMSTDGGQIFGPVLRLAANGTISSETTSETAPTTTDTTT